MKNLSKKVYQGFKSTDIFTQKFTMNFKGQKTYSTLIGAIFSVIIFGICGFYGLKLITVMVNRTMIQTNINKIKTNFEKDPIDMMLNDEGIYVAVSWIGREGNESIDIIKNNLGMINVTLLERIPEGEESNGESASSFTLEECIQENFPLDPNDPSIENRHGHTFYCFKRNDLMKMIKRDIKKGRSYNFLFTIVACPFDICSSYGSRLDYYNYLYFTIISKYFDDSDPLDPIKTYVHDTAAISLSKGFVTELTCLLDRNRYIVNDWHSIITGSKEGEFFNIGECTSFSQKTHDGSTYGVVLFDTNDFIQTYESSVISILEVLGRIGGIFEILSLICSFFIKIITKCLYNRDIKNIQKEVNDHKGWFTFPVKIKARERRLRGLSFASLRVQRNKINPEGSVDPINDRSQLYKDKQSKFDARIKRIKEICRNSKILTEMEEELDTVKISRSLMELKLYVSCLLDKDKITAKDKPDKEFEKEDVHLEEEEKQLPSEIAYPKNFSLPMNKLRKTLRKNVKIKETPAEQDCSSEKDYEDNVVKKKTGNKYSLMY
ncbi:unnamed protein product [Moneuplotes crassus]|uniref:Uncharacterized protein n=1 Tax=Euplotes crassus TaxID=5936 RepID=A0AAD1XYU7_EUPCR|nr:unnamed protein product [Moneuplotes crassus]